MMRMAGGGGGGVREALNFILLHSSLRSFCQRIKLKCQIRHIWLRDEIAVCIRELKDEDDELEIENEDFC